MGPIAGVRWVRVGRSIDGAVICKDSPETKAQTSKISLVMPKRGATRSQIRRSLVQDVLSLRLAWVCHVSVYKHDNRLVTLCFPTNPGDWSRVVGKRNRVVPCLPRKALRQRSHFVTTHPSGLRVVFIHRQPASGGPELLHYKAACSAHDSKSYEDDGCSCQNRQPDSPGGYACQQLVEAQLSLSRFNLALLSSSSHSEAVILLHHDVSSACSTTIGTASPPTHSLAR
jgi:hypothetical protein